MSDLQTLQDKITAAILGGDIAFVAEDFRAGVADPRFRFNILRNNAYASLTACLKTVFPVTVKLSDERFFAYAAHEFITRHPPREARLSRYGAVFPRFLASFEPCRAFPIIAEMAALEWAIAGSLNDAEESPMPMALVGTAVGGDYNAGLRLQPNLRFAISRWPLLGVWADHQKETVVITNPLRKRVSRIAVSRHGEDIQCTELEPSRFAFWRSLARGFTIEAATEKALKRDPLFDLVRETVLLFRSGLVVGVIPKI